MPRTFICPVGTTFGSLTVIGEAPSQPQKRNVFVRCICGQEYSVRASSLVIQNDPACKACRHSHNWKGIGDFSGSHFRSIEAHASRRNLLFEVTQEELWNLFLLQEGKCKYSKLELNLSCKREVTASLDRKDSSKGYTLDNVQWVHKDINALKSNFSEQDFLRLCILVSQGS